MEGGTSHKKPKVSRGENWSLDDRKDLLGAIKIVQNKNLDIGPSYFVPNG